jgi:GGDEF domain-containing protein
VGTSVGVAVHDEDSYGSAEQLLREADTAMYREKQRGR